MHRIDTTTKFTDLFGAGKDGFRDGNKSLGIAATAFNAAWVNSLQEELANTIEYFGGTLDPANNAQLKSTILAVKQKILSISASVASNALTVSLNPTSLDFRSASLTSGAVNTRNVASALTLVIPSTATLGTDNGVQSRLAVLAIDNAGTVELAVVNIAGGNNLDEATLINTTAIAGGSNTSNIIYSAAARTGVPFRVVGYVESTQATAGTWATVPSTIQGAGGNMQFVTPRRHSITPANRVANTLYTNTTGRVMYVNAIFTQTSQFHAFTIGAVPETGEEVSTAAANFGRRLLFQVLPGEIYGWTYNTGYAVPILLFWTETY